MRIISGSARGTRLQTRSVEGLRPMLDRVKEALFNILRADVPEAQVLDLFSGSGGLGLEALSRGASHCVFVERNRVLADLVRTNAEKCRLDDRCDILVADALSLPDREPPSAGVPATLVLADPPYAMVDDPEQRGRLFQALEALFGQWVADGAPLVLHHRPMEVTSWPAASLRETDRRVYGQSQLTFFVCAVGDADA